MSAPEHVFGISDRRYPLGKLLGRGGQGAVFAVEGERLAIKILSRARGANDERLRDKMAMVSRLPIDELPVAKPIERLKPPFVGYVMELFTGMTSFQRLMRPPKDVSSVAQWYMDGGGLGRRLRLLAKIAGILSKLHSKGLIYVDLSPANVFVSEDPGHDEIRLIDTDNLRTSTSAGRTFYTPGYGAPELVQAKASPSSLSDAYAFAVLCFETLSLQHPFKGDHVVYGEPELEERAFAGKEPWIDHSENDLNRSSDGIPRELLLTRMLEQDFRQTFEEGLTAIDKRPGMAQWSEHLHEAADRVISCASCGSGFYFNRPSCPWCGEAVPPFAIAAIHLWDPRQRKLEKNGELVKRPGIVLKDNKKPRLLGLQAIADGNTEVLTRRLTHGIAGNDEQVLRLTPQGDTIAATALVDGLSMQGVQQPRRRWRANQTIRLATQQEGAITIHMDTKDKLHRVVLLDLTRMGGK